MIEIWTLGNTGLRSANRAQDGLRAYAISNVRGNAHGKCNEKRLEEVLYRAGLIGNINDDTDGTYGRKWRLAWCRSGFIYPKLKIKDGVCQEEIGTPDEITPLGQKYIEADTLAATQDLAISKNI